MLLLCRNCGNTLNRAIKVYCNNRCQTDYQYAQVIKKWLSGNYDATIIGGVSKHIRRFLEETYGKKCSLCGWCEYNVYSGTIPLEVDHIDGNWKRSTPDNVRLLCPNCHSLTPTFRNLNKGRGRNQRTIRLLSSVGRAALL